MEFVVEVVVEVVVVVEVELSLIFRTLYESPEISLYILKIGWYLS